MTLPGRIRAASFLVEMGVVLTCAARTGPSAAGLGVPATSEGPAPEPTAGADRCTPVEWGQVTKPWQLRHPTTWRLRGRLGPRASARYPSETPSDQRARPPRRPARLPDERPATPRCRRPVGRPAGAGPGLQRAMAGCARVRRPVAHRDRRRLAAAPAQLADDAPGPGDRPDHPRDRAGPQRAAARLAADRGPRGVRRSALSPAAGPARWDRPRARPARRRTATRPGARLRDDRRLDVRARLRRRRRRRHRRAGRRPGLDGRAQAGARRADQRPADGDRLRGRTGPRPSPTR